MKYIIISLAIFFGTLSHAQLSNISGIINSYYKADSIYTVNCISYVSIASTAGLSIGDDILIIQMQGAVIDTSNSTDFGIVKRLMNSGNFEFATIKEINSTGIELNSMLIKYFTASDKVQIVKIAKYKSAQTIGTVICSPWNGNTGGIIAIDVQDTLLLNASIDASDRGFRGGNLYPNAAFSCTDTRPYWSLLTGFRGPKGEGISTFKTQFEAGMNSIATGGGSGSANNSGAGGGANAGQGGDGGAQSTDCGILGNSGIGAFPIDYLQTSKIFLGGGGGAGQQDQNMGTPGMNGGGIIFIKARHLIGNANSIMANGGNQTADAGNGIICDGAGAGGAGGSIVLDVTNYTSTVNVSARGGKGGNTRIEDVFIATGPGGGGGGGLIWHKGVALPPIVVSSISSGAAGIVINSLSALDGTSYGALDGADGIVKGNYNPVRSNYKHPEITSISNDTVICAYDTVALKASYTLLGNASVQWTPNSYLAYLQNSTAIVAPASDISYYLTISDSIGCYAKDTVTISVWPLPTSNLQDLYIIQLYDSIQLSANVYDSIYWAPDRFIDSINSFTPWFSPPRSQMYRYYIIDSNNCMYYDSLFIKVKQCTDLGLANIFTPNGDGINDVYHFNNLLIDELISFQIFTRWGELVFETNSLSDSWNGQFKGKELANDVYTYQIKGRCYGALFQDSGNISLVR